MVWLVFAIALLALAIYSQVFRWIAVSLVVLAGLGIYVLMERSEQQNREALSRIPHTDIVFEDLRLGPAGSATNYRLTGRVRNRNTQHEASSLTLKIVLLDCRVDQPDACDTVGEASKMLFQPIPPTQVRDVEESVYFPPATRIRSRMAWRYELTEVRANR